MGCGINNRMKLDVVRAGFLLYLIFSIHSYNVFAQCPSSYTLNKQIYCQEENLDISSPEGDYIEFNWDFCSGDLDQIPIGSVSTYHSDFFRARSLKVIQEEDNWYGFAISSTGNNLLRLEFGTELTASPSITNLGKLNGAFSSSFGFDMIKHEGVWYAFVANSGTNNIVRLNFINGLSRVPSIKNLGDFGILTEANNITITYSNDIYIGFVSESTELTRLNFGSDITNSSPTAEKFTISGSNTLRGLSFNKECSDWYGIITSYSNNLLYSVKFSDGKLSGNPIFEVIDTKDVSVRFPANVELVIEGAEYYAYVMGAEAIMYQMKFEESISSFNPIVNDLGKLGLSGQNFALDVIKEGSDWYGFSINLTDKKIARYDFINKCSANTAYLKNTKLPKEINYSAPGKKHITLQVKDSLGNFSYYKDSVEVNSLTSPDILFETENLCRRSTIEFNSKSSFGNITSYNWYFGDSNTAMGDTVQHQYASAGTYQVRLDVDDGTCTNFVTDSITIYEDAPTPVFDYEAISNCTNTDIKFYNLSDASGIPDSLVSYSWNFNNEFTSTTKTDTTVEFTSAGDKNISLTASIPGCNNDTTSTITINEGALVDFAFENSCAGTDVQFTNLTSGTITDLQWSFGNGDSSTVPDPTVVYNSYGDYLVSLEVTNDKGCVTYKTDTITISDIPVADFSYALSCEGLETDFYDESSVNLANIREWNWDINGEHFTEDMPAYIFEESGPYNINMKVTTEFGCADSVTKVLKVLPSPVADFTYDKSCINEPANFQDQSSFVSGNIKEWQWVIDNKTYSKADVAHQFSTSGPHAASLIVTADNLCRNLTVDTIDVHAVPDFSFNSFLACEGQPVEVSSAINTTDPVASYKWYINNNFLGFSEKINYVPMDLNPFQVDLEIRTEGNCNFSSSIEIPVYKTPYADFETSTIFGGAPLEVTYKDFSSGGSKMNWFINDMPMLVESGRANKILEIGDYLITQVVSTDIGCSDSAFVNIEVVEPTLDLGLQKVRVISDAGNQSFLLDILNKGSAQIKEMEVDVSVNNEVNFKENISSFLNSGDTLIKLLVSTLERRPRFMCFTVNAQGTELNEEDALNNRMCLNFEDISFLLKPYPNPADDNVTIPILLRESDNINITVINSLGAIVYETSVSGMKDEMINYNLPVKHLPQGYYIVKVVSGIQEQTFPIIINH